jgi:hypothetical protein
MCAGCTASAAATVSNLHAGSRQRKGLPGWFQITLPVCRLPAPPGHLRPEHLESGLQVVWTSSRLQIQYRGAVYRIQPPDQEHVSPDLQEVHLGDADGVGATGGPEGEYPP